MPSALMIIFSFSAMTVSEIGLNSKRWQRDTIVGSTLWASVVAKKNFTCSGGSSKVFNKALKAAVESICTSSII